MELVILIGLPGAGKSTFYERRLSATHARISKDLMRNAKRKQERQLMLLRELLRAGRSVAIDNTNMSRADRAPLIAIARKHGAKVIGFHFPPSISDCLRRNQRRTGRAWVPDIAIFDAKRRYEAPNANEGFDELSDVSLDDGDFAVKAA